MAGSPPASSSAPPPKNPPAPAAYRLADSTGPRTTAPRPTAAPPRINPPRTPNPFARQAAKASWISFIFALVFSKLFPHHDPVFMTAVALFQLIGFALAVIALFGIRRYGTSGILVPAVIGLILNGIFVVALLVVILVGVSKRHEFQGTKRHMAASLNEYAQQVKSGVPVNQMPSTGDANIDAGFQIIVDLGNEGRVVMEKMDAEIAQLHEKQVGSVITNKDAIKLELGKRTAGQGIIQNYEREAAALVASAKQRCLASTMPAGMKQEMLRQLDKGGQFQALLDERFSLSVRRQEAEFDFLQFLHAEFGRYRLADEAVRFAAPPKQEEYNRLSQRLQDVFKDTEAFDRRRSEGLEALPDRIKQLTK
jgi:hypothetical protein